MNSVSSLCNRIKEEDGTPIYSDMADAGLPALEYIETPNMVRLILRNNIDELIAHRNRASSDVASEAILILKKQGALGRAEIAKSLEISDRTISRKLNHLIELDCCQNKWQ